MAKQKPLLKCDKGLLMSNMGSFIRNVNQNDTNLETGNLNYPNRIVLSMINGINVKTRFGEKIQSATVIDNLYIIETLYDFCMMYAAKYVSYPLL